MLCNHQQILGIVLSSTNHIRCKFTLGHLFFFVLKNAMVRASVCFAQEWFILDKTCGNIGIGWNITLDNFIRCTCWSRKKMLTRPWSIVIYLWIVHVGNLRSILTTIAIGSIIFLTCFILVRIIRCYYTTR